jgi:VCBS repeat protein/GlcNAc-PI de-N-acetylase
VTRRVRNARTSLLALFLVGALGAGGAAQTPPATISITGMPKSVTAGSPITLTVTVRDDEGAPMTGYTGTVHFASNDPDAAVPDDYTFKPGDAGTHRFTFTPAVSGRLTIDVSDATAGLYGWQTASVEPRAQSSRDLARPAASPATVAAAPAVPVAAGPAVAGPAVVTPPGHMYFVAHEDDDLLFMNPDIENSIRQGLPVRTVFFTAAASTPGSQSPPPWYAREDGVPNAYRAMADVSAQPADWSCQLRTFVTNKVVRQCTLTTRPLVSVVFVRLPDGGTDPVNQPGMAALWAGSVPSLASLTRPETPPTPSSTYTRTDLINLTAALINDFAPALVGTQDSSPAYGPDHADHVAGAQFALMGDHFTSRTHDMTMYRGYDINVWWTPPDPAPEMQNLSSAQYDEKLRVMEAYGGTLPPGSPWDPFCARRYAFSRLSGRTGLLAAPGGLCLGASSNPADGDPVVAAPCSATSTRWTVTPDGRIASLGALAGLMSAQPVIGGDHHSGSLAVADPKPNRPRHRLPATSVFVCLAVSADLSVKAVTCAETPVQAFSVMSNGQVRAAGATCLGVANDGVTVQAQSCAAERYSTSKYQPIATQRWVQQMGDASAWSSGSQFSDADLGAPDAYARSFRLGDVNGDGYADACIRLGGGVYCALNTSGGGFAPYALYSAAFSDAAGWLPAAYGSTLQLGDVNGDGKADVCGRKGDGIWCATANADGSAFDAASRWSTDFSDGDGWGASAGYYGSIHLGDVNGDGYADVCGRSPAGIVCALNNKAGGFSSATLWSGDFTDAQGWQPDQYGSTIQLGDINGDGKADVCGRGPNGVQCATASAGAGFADTRPWSLRNDFSDADGWSAGAAYYGSIRLADINGDGKADVCGRNAGGLVCAIANGAGFDVAQPVTLQAYSDGLGWSGAAYGATIQFADLGHDGRRDVCGRAATGLVCAKAP